MNELTPGETTIERLASRADLLGKKVDGLTSEVSQLNRRQGRTERLSIRTAGVLALLIVLAMLVGVLAWQQWVTRDQVAQLVGREVKTRDEALCPLAALLLGGYDPTTRPPGPAREQYEENFRIQREAYAALNCTNPLVPPRTATT